jgi:glycosyltransferase involved in cell wall biosynthesis
VTARLTATAWARPRPSAARTARIDRVVVISDDVSLLGGAAAVAHQSIERLAAEGVPVTLLVGQSPPSAPLPANVEVEPLSGGRLGADAGLRAAASGLFDLGVRNRVAQWIARHDTPRTIYHLHNWHKSLSPSVFQALRAVERRLVMTAHDYFLVCPNGAYYDFRAHQVCELEPLSFKCLSTNCDKRRFAHKAWRVARHGVRSRLYPLGAAQGWVLAPHEGVTPYLVRGGVRPDRIRTLRNPVTPWSETRIEAEKQRQVLFVGRLETDKGVHLLAEAAERCGVALTIVGEGPLAAPLAEAYPRHTFLGARSRAELAGIASQSRLLVVASLWPETFGLVTFEALLSGLPVLLSRNALVAEELRQLDAAEVFNPEDLDAFSVALSRAVKDSVRLAELSARGFALRSELAPSPEMWGSGLVAIYRAVLERVED